MADLLTRLQAEALSLGFEGFGIAAPRLPSSDVRLQAWLEKGYHGGMAWMEGRADERASPLALWGEVQSVIMLGMNYAPPHNPLIDLDFPLQGAISVYAQGDDYHEVIKPRLKTLARWLVGETACDVKVFVDTAPVMEKPLAMQAGLGWQGKHSNLVSREAGSWLFLGAIYTTLAFAPSEASRDSCGSCQACLDVCPTKAFPSPYVVDARRCISYLTIEHHGLVARELRPLMGNRIYGCDDCLSVCPWNKFAHEGDGRFQRAELRAPLLASLLALDDAAFRTLFRKSPVKRIGRARFLRNVLNAVGNSGEIALVPKILPLLHDEAEVVRAMAVWALRQLSPSSLMGFSDISPSVMEELL
jgi:epoxyqueuosine reductase